LSPQRWMANLAIESHSLKWNSMPVVYLQHRLSDRATESNHFLTKVEDFRRR
jgi:hypothetical protein